MPWKWIKEMIKNGKMIKKKFKNWGEKIEGKVGRCPEIFLVQVLEPILTKFSLFLIILKPSNPLPAPKMKINRLSINFSLTHTTNLRQRLFKAAFQKFIHSSSETVVRNCEKEATAINYLFIDFHHFLERGMAQNMFS